MSSEDKALLGGGDDDDQPEDAPEKPHVGDLKKGEFEAEAEKKTRGRKRKVPA